MVDLVSLPVAPTMFLLVSPLSTPPAVTVELIIPLLPSPCDSYLPLRLPGLTQFQPVGLLSTLDKQVHPDGLRRLLNRDGTQKVL